MASARDAYPASVGPKTIISGGPWSVPGGSAVGRRGAVPPAVAGGWEGPRPSVEAGGLPADAGLSGTAGVIAVGWLVITGMSTPATDGVGVAPAGAWPLATTGLGLGEGEGDGDGGGRGSTPPPGAPAALTVG